MAAITLKGIRLESLSVERDTNGKLELKSASYSLLSSTGHVLASQTIGGYNSSIKVQPSPDTTKLLNSFLDSYRKDITTTLGLEDIG